MTVIQTRVPDTTAQDFETVAKKRSISVYALLKELIEQAIRTEKAEGWETQSERLKGVPRLPFNACEKAREGENR